jgi:hypothetical protein
MSDQTTTETTTHELEAWIGFALDDVRGVGVGRVDAIVTGEREFAWMLARMGRFGHHTAIPSRDAVEGVERIWVPYSRDQIRHAPHVEALETIDPLMERELLAHYGLVPG